MGINMHRQYPYKACPICGEKPHHCIACHKEKATICMEHCKSCKYHNVSLGQWHCAYKEQVTVATWIQGKRKELSIKR